MFRRVSNWIALFAMVAVIGWLAYARGHSRGTLEAFENSADAWICYVYADKAARPVGQVPTHVAAELERAEKEYGELGEVDIYRVDSGPAKTIIRLRVMRGNNACLEEIVLIGGELRDFSSRI